MFLRQYRVETGLQAGGCKETRKGRARIHVGVLFFLVKRDDEVSLFRPIARCRACLRWLVIPWHFVSAPWWHEIYLPEIAIKRTLFPCRGARPPRCSSGGVHRAVQYQVPNISKGLLHAALFIVPVARRVVQNPVRLSSTRASHHCAPVTLRFASSPLQRPARTGKS